MYDIIVISAVKFRSVRSKPTNPNKSENKITKKT